VLHVKRSAHWKQLTTICLVLSFFAVASLLLNILSRGLPYLSENPGLAQRVAFAFYFAWFVIAGFLFTRNSQIHRVTRSTSVNDQVDI